MTVVAGKSMRVTVQIPYAKKETLADKASFVAFPHGAEVRAARFISSVATPVKGMIAAEFEVDNSDDLYQGIPVEIHLLRKKEELIVLSVKSIQRDELKPWETYVNVSKDGESVKTPVVLGESYGGKVVIKSGLSVKDRVL